MNEFLIMLASLTPKELIVEKLIASVKEYEMSFGEESKAEALKTLEANCMMLTMKLVTPDVESGIEMVKGMKDFESMNKLFNVNKS